MNIGRVSNILFFVYFIALAGFVYHRDNTLENLEARYTIVAKKQGISDLMGNGGWWIQKKWDNGRIQSEFIRDPFVADTLTVGKTYVVPGEAFGWFGYVMAFVAAIIFSVGTFFFFHFCADLKVKWKVWLWRRRSASSQQAGGVDE